MRSDRFAVVDLSRIATGEATTLYTDYTHLTAAGNRRLAALLMPHVVRMLEQGPPATDD